jgi:hypothetical protein
VVPLSNFWYSRPADSATVSVRIVSDQADVYTQLGGFSKFGDNKQTGLSLVPGANIMVGDQFYVRPENDLFCAALT